MASNSHQADKTPQKTNQKVLSHLRRQYAHLVDVEVIDSVVYACNFNGTMADQRLSDICDLRPETHLRSAIAEKPVSDYDRIVADYRSGYRMLILMRGLPGSGKSTLARRLINDVIGPCNPREFIFSTDDFFMRNAEYSYNPSMLSDAHMWNQKRVHTALESDVELIIVDNTNTQSWEMRPYCIWAVSAGYKLHVLEPKTSWASNPRELARRNTHNVCKDKLKAMLDRYQSSITADQLMREFDLKYAQPLKRKHLESPPEVILYQDGATCCRENSGKGKILYSTGDFISCGQLPLKYPKERRFDQSTQTTHDDIDGGKRDGLDILAAIFPKVPEESLSDVLQNCGGDIEWATELLLEDTQQFLVNYTHTKLTPAAIQEPATTSTPEKVHSHPIAVSTEGEDKVYLESVRQQLEASVHINPEYYSPHVRKLKGYVMDEGPSTSAGTSISPDLPQADSDLDFDDEAGGDNGEDAAEDVIEVEFGETMIRQLNTVFGDLGVKLPAGFQPLVEMPKTLAQQLHALYLESVFKQLENYETLVESMVEEDETFAMSLQLEEMRTSTAREQPPSLKQIMRDELAAQRQSRFAAKEWERMAPDDIAHKLSLQKLAANFPDVDAGVLAQLLAAHGNIFKDAVRSLCESGARFVDAPMKRTLSAETLAEMKCEHAAAGDADEGDCKEKTQESSIELRARAEAFQTKRRELLERARHYHRRGMKEAAAFFAGLASRQTQLYDRYNSLAAVKTINENFHRASGTDTLDLHYLRGQEAVIALDIFIDEVINQLQTHKGGKGKSFYTVQIITGRGKHSRNGVAIIRPKVQARLRKRKLQFQMLNEGVLRVKILRNSITTDLLK